ncbi:aminotransferase class I/II-fold pyridoxal phosphate-dependent enzyme [Chloroflexia bacterium SDU3-3]|nr:aminotransferase class I/II-fold pyridoxal phosphate-dependent enzyme [Chloroflexia bacterium SDU3-3]
MRSIPLAHRVSGFGTSIFTEITALAIRHSAINLGQGFPDFASPDFVKQAAADAIRADMNQYAPASGLPQLRQAIAAQWERDYGHAPDWEHEVTVTSGATEALCDAILGLCNPGDKLIVFEPAYDAYVADLTMAGAEPIFVRLYPPLYESGAWSFDEGELEQAFAQQPKAILINTPHNPTGKVFTTSELELIAHLCREHNVLAITDEVYDRIVFDLASHVPLATLPGMWDRTLTINSMGKTFSVTGWKVGYAIGPQPLIHAVRQAHQWVTFATATPFQQAAAQAIAHSGEAGYYTQLVADYAERRAMLQASLAQAGLPALPTEGSFFTCVDIGSLGVMDANAFCYRLITEAGVAAIPISAFYREPEAAPALVRFCFAKTHETLAAAGERLAKFRI